MKLSSFARSMPLGPVVRAMRALGPVCLAAIIAAPIHAQNASAEASWPTYGGDPGGQRYSPADQINKSNLDHLHIAWKFHAEAPADMKLTGHHASAEATPILFKGLLYLSSPFDQVFAVDPETGAQRWSYDAKVDWGRSLGIIASRGVASWSSPQPQQAGKCADRIFIGTVDARLIAMDAATGEPCADFGSNGTVDLTSGVDFRKGDAYGVTSPPTVVGDVVVVGSSVGDNVRVDLERGDVRGYDAVTGKLLWSWNPMPWADSQKLRTGAANTWGVIAADLEHGIVYLPTSSPSPDHYGGMRPGDNRDSDSIVALNAKTGQKIWSFQVVHHDVWDYDIASEPLLFTFHKTIPAVAVATKMGMIFAFNRLTGEPLYPVTERAVPKSDVPGEVTSPTQPFMDLPSISPLTVDLSKPLGLTSADDTECRKTISSLRYEGIFTPPSLRGTVLFPSPIGGVNWGSTAFDPTTGNIYANNNRLPFSVTLTKRPLLDPHMAMEHFKITFGLPLLLIVLLASFFKGRTGFISAALFALVVGAGLWHFRGSIAGYVQGDGVSAHFGREFGMDQGTPYTLMRQPVNASSGHPCAPPPWGAITAINLDTGKLAWETPLGTMEKGLHTGSGNVGGPLVTGGGLVFSAATDEPFLRAFDSGTGAELWQGELPITAHVTPMSYSIHGKQYVVVFTGGHFAAGDSNADTAVAFALQ